MYVCSVGQYSAIPYTQNMHVECKIVTNNPQVMRKLTEFAKMCCACNTSLKLVLRTSVTTSHVTCSFDYFLVVVSCSRLSYLLVIQKKYLRIVMCAVVVIHRLFSYLSAHLLTAFFSQFQFCGRALILGWSCACVKGPCCV